jgi:hypothetical protein
MKQTSIDWLKEQLTVQVSTVRKFRKKTIVKHLSFEELSKLIEKAKEMHYQEQIDLVQHLKDYTYESHNILGFDEREASEFVDIFNQTFNQ